MDAFEQDLPTMVEDPARLASAYDAHIKAILAELIALVGAAPGYR